MNMGGNRKRRKRRKGEWIWIAETALPLALPLEGSDRARLPLSRRQLSIARGRGGDRPGVEAQVHAGEWGGFPDAVTPWRPTISEALEWLSPARLEALPPAAPAATAGKAA